MRHLTDTERQTLEAAARIIEPFNADLAGSILGFRRERSAADPLLRNARRYRGWVSYADWVKDRGTIPPPPVHLGDMVYSPSYNENAPVVGLHYDDSAVLPTGWRVSVPGYSYAHGDGRYRSGLPHGVYRSTRERPDSFARFGCTPAQGGSWRDAGWDPHTAAILLNLAGCRASFEREIPRDEIAARLHSTQASGPHGVHLASAAGDPLCGECAAPHSRRTDNPNDITCPACIARLYGFADLASAL